MKTITLLLLVFSLVGPTANEFRDLGKDANPKSNCVCYAKGTSYEIGEMECLGGFWAACHDRPEDSGTNCGWDYVLEDGNQVRCDGE